MNSLPVAGGRRLLLAGFGGLLLLLLVAGSDALLVLGQVRSSDTQVRDAYLHRSQTLDRVRAGIYQSAIVMRDFLLSADHDIGREQVTKWQDIRRRTDQALAECATVLDPAETVPFRSLKAEVGAYWKLLEFISEMRQKNRRNRGALLWNWVEEQHTIRALPWNCGIQSQGADF